MHFILHWLAGLSLAAAIALPETTPRPDLELAKRATPVTNQSQLNASIAAISKSGGAAYASGFSSLYKAIVPSSAPTDDAGARSRLASAYAAYPTDPLAAGAAILLSGAAGQNPIGDPGTDAGNFGACNSDTNSNPPPPQPVYPKKGPNDAPYDVSEASLRAAIYFPPGFTNGKVKPAVFIPGTGVEACESFANNLGKLFTGSNYADPVYVNIPGNSLEDVQVTAEYAAYAINYISSLTNSNVTVLSWSQGSLSIQWALKYWPSTRNAVSDFIAVSPDFHGTVEVPLICPPGSLCAPSVLQQNYNSKFISVIRSNGGDSAYVPTTTIHSIYDEVVEPQQDPNASGNLGSANGVPVTNVQIQDVCPPPTVAGFPAFGHENSLYNPVTFAVAMDAIKNPGPANVARSGASGDCGTYYANGLTLADVFATEALIPLAGYNIETYPNKTTTEPPIKPYAAQ